MSNPSYLSLSSWSTDTAPTNYQDIVYLNNGSSYGTTFDPSRESTRYPDRVRNASDMNQLIEASDIFAYVDFLPENASVQQIANKFQEVRAKIEEIINVPSKFPEIYGEFGFEYDGSFDYDLDKIKSLAFDFYCNVENPGSSLCTGPRSKAKEEIYKPSLVNKALQRPYLTAGVAIGSLGALFLLIRALRGNKRKLLF